MPDFPIEIAPEQVLNWLKSEIAMRPNEFSVRAEREFVAAPTLDKQSAGIAEDTDLSAVAAVGRLEVQPLDPSDGWVLRMRVEDQLGDHLPDGRSVAEQVEEIDLDTFEELFLTPADRALVETVLVAETQEAARRAGPIFSDILTDHHAT